MNYQEIENKLVEFAHKREGKDFPIHDVDVGTAVEFAIELVKNCPTPNLAGRSEELQCDECSGNGGGVTDNGWEKCDCQK